MIKLIMVIVLLTLYTSAEEPTSPPMIQKRDSHFYVGGGYGYPQLENITSSSTSTANAFTGLAGYKFFKHLALEGRYNIKVGNFKGKAVNKKWYCSNTALYLKPSYSIKKFTTYGLVGYGHTSLGKNILYGNSAFQWGVGANYAATQNLEVFVDYTHIFDDTKIGNQTPATEMGLKNFNLGILYNF